MPSIAEDIALRIGLAARELPDTDAARLLRVLEDLIEFPPTADKLEALTVKDLKAAAEGEFADQDPAVLKTALAYLKGQLGISQPALPTVEPYTEGDLPGSIRVAVASNSGEMLDGHFGSCLRFLIYQVSAQAYRLIDIRATDGAHVSDDKNAYRASLIQDCQIIFIISIGGPAAAKVVRVGAHPVKKAEPIAASEEMRALQQAIAHDPPPWLAKVMGQTPQQRIRFAQDAELTHD